MIVRELFAKLGLDVDKAQFKAGDTAIKAVGLGLGALVLAAGAAVAGVIELTRRTVEYGSKLNDAAQAVGLQTDALQELEYAAGLSGVKAEELHHALERLAKSGKVSGPLDKGLERLADRFQQMPDGAAKTRLAMEYFGKSGAKLVPLLNEGSKGIEQLRQEARDLGIVMDKESIKAADDLGDSLETLKLTAEGLRRSIVVGLLPELRTMPKDAVKWLRDNRKTIREVAIMIGRGMMAAFRAAAAAGRALAAAGMWVVKHWKLVAIVFASVAAGVLASMTGSLVAMTVAAIRLGVAGVIAAVRFAAAWALANAPFIAIGAAVAALLLLLDDVRVYQRGGKSLFGIWQKTIADWLKPNDRDPWWLVAIKTLVAKMGEALGLAKQLGLVKEPGAKAPADAAAAAGAVDRNTGRAPFVAAPPVQFKDADPDSLSARIFRFFGATNPMWVGRPVGSDAIPARPVGQGTVLAPKIDSVTFNVTAQPGQDTKALGEEMRDQWEAWWNGKMEETAAAF